MEYNSSRPHLIIPEYGRNVQKMVKECMEIEERERRNAVAKAIIEIIGNLNPQIRDAPDYRHKLWDHLFIMSDFQLDVDSPYPVPERESFEKKPRLIEYPVKSHRRRHYGNIIKSIVKKLRKLDKDDPDRDILIVDLANQMKKSYLTWNKDTVQDEQIWEDLSQLSDGELKRPEGAELGKSHSLTQGLQKMQKEHTGRNRGKRNRKKNKKRYRKPAH